LAVSCDTSVEIRALDTGKVVADLQGPVAPNDLAWRPDGKTLAVVGSDSRIYLWDVAAGKQTLVLEGLRNAGITIAFNHAGDLLASTGWEGKLRLWDPRSGKQLFSTPSWMSSGAIPRFSPDDRLLAADIRDDKLGLWEVAAGGEYRTLVRAAAVGKGGYSLASIRSDGRLLAVAMENGVGLWELPSGKELSFLESPGTNFVLFEPSGALLTKGSAGLLRWPVQADAASPELLRVGPPHKLSVPGPICHVACSHDGRVIAVSQWDGGRVLHADRPDQPVRLGPHDDARYVAVSPDGRWVATGSHSRTGVKIWDAWSGELAKELPLDGSCVGFSPDGTWLATTGGGLRLWAVGSWREGSQIGGGAFAFAPDGKLLAVETGYGAVRLVNPDTGREYARLEDPNLDRVGYGISFTPDGTQLAATNNDSQSIHVWDLRAIREQLVKMDLDWDLPPYPPAAADAGKPLRVEVDPGDLGAMIQAQDYWQRALGLALPDPKCRDPRPAVELGTKAVQLAPKDGNCWFTLGVAQYRAGNWKAALESLEKGMPLRNGGDCGDWFFLAMVHWQLGDKAQALQWYEKGDQWMATHDNGDWSPAWPPLRAEAAELLGIGKKKD
jgi:WD40 repeat protein